MRKVIRKWFWVWQFEKEVKWLNEMAAKGLGLIGVGWAKYEFEECEPGEYVYQLELLEHAPNHAESQQYLHFLEETGVEHVGSYSRWVYLRRKRELGEFKLFSDHAMKVKHLDRIMMLMTPLFFINLYNFTWNFHVGMEDEYVISPVNLTVSILCLLATLLIGYGLLTVGLLRRKLKKEAQLFE